jgi:hypothetical protein
MVQRLIGLLALAAVPLLLSACGGGGGSSGGAVTGLSGAAGAVSLTSISFPEYTDLTGGSTSPPVSAPLAQQVVLTFSGSVQGVVPSGAVEITANPGKDYFGPDAALDKTKNLIVARGELEIMNNVVVFTPYIPTNPIDLSTNAPLENIPGLLPGYTYSVFVPVNTESSVKNLTSIDSGVKNPVHFSTCNSESLYFNYRNLPALAPEVTSSNPPDGATDFNFFPLKHRYDVKKEEDEIVLKFNQPLDFRYDNLEGTDYDNDGVREQNLFLKYTSPMAYVAVDQFFVQKGFIGKLDTELNEMEFVGFTNDLSLEPEKQNIGLKSILLLNPAKMVGCSSDALYDVDFMDVSGTPLVCELTNKRELSNVIEASSLTLVAGSKAYALNTDPGSLLQELVVVNLNNGVVKSKGVLTSDYGIFVDLAMGYDNQLYGLSLEDTDPDPTKNNWIATIERIKPSSLLTEPLITDLYGNFQTMEFIRPGVTRLFDYDSKRVAELDLAQPSEMSFGEEIDYPLLLDYRSLNFRFVKYELGVTPELVNNSHKGAEVKLTPSGILPLNAWLNIMVRSSLTSLSGGSRHTNHGDHPMEAWSVAIFKTRDPGSDTFNDFFEEKFIDNEMEELNHELANAAAIWNMKDIDGEPPNYTGLLATLGLTGAGELGDFEPIGITPTVFLDTNYQPLPLFDGSTPGVSEPVIITDGEFHFHNITIPFNVTIQAQGTNPLILTATGDVDITGTIDISGIEGATDVTFNSAYIPTPGGKGGPGGGRGGMGQPPIPPDFSALTQLQTPTRGERGWGPGDAKQIGGWGGESGAKGVEVPWAGSAHDSRSRGAGGGGGGYLMPGKQGYPGLGRYGVDEEGTYVIRDAWEYWDGTYKYDTSWNPGDPLENQDRLNHWFADDPDPDIARAPHPGDAGELVFKDVDIFGEPNTANDFIGRNGELKEVQGGQGGGGGGTRMDSMNPETENQALQWNPPLAPSAYDSKGGGGGGGGGAIAIHALGEIRIRTSGRILARGGRGGGGEVIGHSNFGGGGGGGSGGAIILNSATKIVIDHEGDDENAIFGVLDVSGGRGADARANVLVTWQEIPDPCQLDNKGKPKYIENEKSFCHWSRSDGGAGGHGIIQLMVPDPATDLEMVDYPDPGGNKDEYRSILAEISEVDYLPSEKKYKPAKTEGIWAKYSFTSKKEVGSDWYKIWPKTGDCLVDPEKSISTINSLTFAVSKWIDMGRISERPPINGKKGPVFLNSGFHGFRGISIGSLDESVLEDWGIVNQINGFVVIDPSGENDITVNSPDKYLNNYIDETNTVGILFQGTDALVPGSKVPDPDAATPWTTELNTLSGKQFVRYKIGLNVANGTEISTNSVKPQVNHVKIRFKY